MFFLSEKINYRVGLTNNKKAITNHDFMKFVKIDLYNILPNLKKTHSGLLKYNDPKFTDTGIYSKKVRFENKIGSQRFELIVTGKTFSRSLKQIVNVHDYPAKINEIDLKKDKKTQAITISTSSELLDTGSLVLVAKIIFPNKKQQTLALIKTTDNRWRLNLPAIKTTQKYALNVTLNGKTVSRRSFVVNLPTYFLKGKIIVAKHYPLIFTKDSDHFYLFASYYPHYLDSIRDKLDKLKEKIKIIPENKYPEFAAEDHGRAHAHKEKSSSLLYHILIAISTFTLMFLLLFGGRKVYKKVINKRLKQISAGLGGEDNEVSEDTDGEASEEMAGDDEAATKEEAPDEDN